MLNLVLLNTANVLYVFCYGVRDVLWLRILAVIAMLLLIPYYANQIEPMTSCIYWQAIFIAVNAFWIVVIFRDRRPPVMTEAEQHLYDSVFKGCCSPNDMLRLVAEAKWNEAGDGVRLIKRRTDLNQLLLIHNGVVSVQVDGQEVATLESGNLVGEMSYLSRNKTNADVFTRGTVQYLSWSREVLEELFNGKVELKSAMYEIVGRDLVRKLTSLTEEEHVIGMTSV